MFTIGQPTKNSTKENPEFIQLILINDLDQNLTPLSVTVVLTTGSKKYEYTPMRFTVPHTKKEFEDIDNVYNKIIEKMDKLAKEKAKDMKTWNSKNPLSNNVDKQLSSKFNLIKDGISGKTIINLAKFDKKLDLMGGI